MAANTIRPGATPPPRGNTVRPRPEAVPPVVAAPAVPEPAPAPEPVAPAPPAPAPAPAPRPKPQPRRGPSPLTAEEAEVQASEWKQAPGSTATGWSLFALLDRFTGLDGLFREGLPVRYLPKLLFVMGLTLLYIGNTHYGNRMNRSIQKIKQEVEDLRADYTTLKSDYMEASKQSEVARKVAAIGLVEPSSPPFRIAVPAGRLDDAELADMPVLTTDTLAARAARDSVVQARADSIEGRVRRQQLGLPADDTPEAGAPPPGLADEEATSGNTAANQQNSSNPGSAQEASASHSKRESSTKKHKAAQEVQRSKSRASGDKAEAHSTRSKANHEKQR